MIKLIGIIKEEKIILKVRTKEGKKRGKQMETKKEFPLFQGEKGITLVALIITIIVLVILAAVSIMLVYRTRIVNYAINGTMNYAGEGIKENKVLEGTESLIESAVKELEKIRGGETSPTPNPPTPPEETGLPKEELEREEMIGRYVDYNPQGTDYTVDGTYSGTGFNQTFSKNDDMKWRIWGVEGNKLLLISETLAGNIQLQGANGYNNAVKILNDACAQAYGNSSYGSAIKVRSINQDDIDKVTNMTTDAQRKAVTSSYGTTVTPSYKQCPIMYNYEPGKTGGGTLDRSVQYNNNSWVTGTSTMTSGKWTHYRYSITNYATQTIYDALLTNMSASSTSGTDSHTAYWVASRCVHLSSSYAYFRVFIVYGGNVDANGLYYSNGGTYSYANAVRPVVEVNLDSIAIGGTGSGTASSPYSMVKK